MIIGDRIKYLITLRGEEMTDSERREAARQFVNKWNGHGNED